jgi:hypothetical protein
MKAKTRSKTKSSGSRRSSTKGGKANGPRKNIEDRDLNSDEQEQVTNVENDEGQETTSNPENSAG